jgi:superfamily II DNA or RNA helicase
MSLISGNGRATAAPANKAVPTTVAGLSNPRLTLLAETLFDEDGEERPVAALRLDFLYQGTAVRSSSTTLGMAGGRRRDVNAEAEARRILEGLGAVELACLGEASLSMDADVDYVVRVDADVHALCGFTAYAVPHLRKRGWQVDIDPEYPWQVVEQTASVYAGANRSPDRPDWFSIELGIEIDGHRISLLGPLLQLLDQAAGIEALARSARRCIAVRIDDKRWLTLPPERMRLLCKVLQEMYREGPTVSAPMSRVSAIAEVGAALYEEERPFRWTGDTSLRDRAYDFALGPRSTDVAPPLKMVNAQLRDYQHEGVRWMQHLRAHNAGGILADDMGLGKTLQTIAHVAAEKEAGRLDRPAMILTLTSVLGNWQRELARFAPGLRVLTIGHAPRAVRQARCAEVPDYDVILTTYPLVVRDQEALAVHEYHLLILDEAHSIKNPSAQAREAVVGLNARHRMCLSGTPIENNLTELWSLLDFLMPGMLGTGDQFQREFRAPIEEHGDRVRLEALRERVRPYILRRTKTEVAKELPPKTELVRSVELSGAQRELYESIRVAAHAEVREHIKSRGAERSTIAVLDALLKLRQACCDPRLCSVEAARALGPTPPTAKLDLLTEMLQTQLAAGSRILVFSQFARMLALISERLLGLGIGHVTLTGQTPDRQRPIDAFENGRADVFLISLRAGGTGLNLTSADTVIHYDPWWNPTAQAQATDRAYRIGQKKPVFAYNLIAAGSVEERMLGLQQRKRRIADAILSKGSAPCGALTEREIEDLMAPLADR